MHFEYISGGGGAGRGWNFNGKINRSIIQNNNMTIFFLAEEEETDEALDISFRE